MKFSESRSTPKYICSGRLYKTKQYCTDLVAKIKSIKNIRLQDKQNRDLTQTKDIEKEQSEDLKMCDRSHMNTYQGG